MKKIFFLIFAVVLLSSCKTVYKLPKQPRVIYKKNNTIYTLKNKVDGSEKKAREKIKDMFIPEGELFVVLGRGKHLYSEHIPDYVYFFFFDGKHFSVFQAEDFQKKIIMTEKELKKFFPKINTKEIKKIKKRPYQIYWTRKKDKSPFH